MEHGSLKSRQIKAARALLDWSQEDLAAHSGLSVATIRKLELGHISPRGKTSHAIRHAFEDNGLEFLEPDGVRHRPDDIRIYQGEEGIRLFFDDVFQACLRGSEVVQVWPSCKDFHKVIGSYKDEHIERMTQIKSRVKMRAIITEDPNAIILPYAQYRFLSRHYVDSVPFYVYSDKYAIVSFAVDADPKIIVIQSLTASESFRRQFQSMWDKATPLNPPEVSVTKKKVRGRE